MSGVNFKGLYEVPFVNSSNLYSFIDKTGSLRDKTKKSSYNEDNRNLYIYVDDTKDREFVDFAAQYKINYKKINPSDMPKQKPPALKEQDFIESALLLFAKSKVEQNGDIKKITLYGDGEIFKGIYAIYEIKDNKIISKTEFTDGKESATIYYDENGNYKKTVIKGEKTDMVFDHNKDGNFEKFSAVDKK